MCRARSFEVEANSRLSVKRSIGNVSKLGKAFLQISIALELNLSLVGAFASWRAFAVASVELVYNIHSFNHLADGRESLIVQKSISLLPSIDEDLSCSSVFASRSKHHCTSIVADLDRIVAQILRSPFGLSGWVTIDAKLRDKSWKDAKDATVVPESNGS